MNLHTEFIPTCTHLRCRQAYVVIIMEKNPYVQLDNHLSVPSLNKYKTIYRANIIRGRDKTHFESISNFGEYLSMSAFVFCMWVYWQQKWAIHFDLFKDLTHTLKPNTILFFLLRLCIYNKVFIYSVYTVSYRFTYV